MLLLSVLYACLVSFKDSNDSRWTRLIFEKSLKIRLTPAETSIVVCPIHLMNGEYAVLTLRIHTMVSQLLMFRERPGFRFQICPFGGAPAGGYVSEAGTPCKSNLIRLTGDEANKVNFFFVVSEKACVAASSRNHRILCRED
jgi:hypothetical protein